MVRGVISDVDGTLVDSNDAHASAWEEAFREFGLSIPWEEIRSQVGRGSDQLLPEFLSPEQLSSIGTQIDKRKKEVFRKEYFDQIKPFPGVLPLFEKLYRDKKTIVLATSGSANETQHYIRLLGIERFVRDIVTGDDVARTKPHPDLFHIALDRFGWDPVEAVVLGDTPYDIEAAQKVDLATIALLTGGFSEEALTAAGAAEIYRSLQTLLENYDVSYLGRNHSFNVK